MKLSFSTLACPEYSFSDMYAMAKDLGFDGIEVRGLMTMAPQGDLAQARACFAQLRELRDEIQTMGIVDDLYFNELSMGMTEDWREAIEEGATMVRVGTGIFGERNYNI